MTFEVDVAGRTRTVSIERGGRAEQFRVTIDGRAHDVRARRAGEWTLLLSLGTVSAKTTPGSADKLQGDGTLETIYEVSVAPSGGPGEVLVTLGGRVTPAAVNSRRTGRAADTGGPADGEQRVVAPMPGRVVRVLVSPGDQVTARQGVVVVEAMKMENELRAPKGGRVKDVSVSPGTSVEAGRVLVVIE